MFLQFPKNFVFGTSTAAAQIETAFDHEWKGLIAKDGNVFNRTSDHELHRNEDAKYIAQLGSAYRMSVDWSKLQTQPYSPFNPQVVAEYQQFLETLTQKYQLKIMMVLHHFTNPNWFVKAGSWTNPNTLPLFINYVKQIVQHFGKYVTYWNTFNEPQAYIFSAYIMGHFPPHQHSLFKAHKVLKNMSKAHRHATQIIRQSYPNTLIGISNNSAIFKPENLISRLPAYIADYVFNEYVADHFTYDVDFIGLSYYARIPLTPFAITEVDTPGKLDKLNRPHDKMWEYHPEGMKTNILRYWKRYHQKPIIITESGICTDNSKVRISSIKDYLKIIYDCINTEKIDIQAYFHWSTFDNFEWNLGNTYRFGLVHINFETGERTIKPCGKFYEKIVQQHGVEI